MLKNAFAIRRHTHTHVTCRRRRSRKTDMQMPVHLMCSAIVSLCMTSVVALGGRRGLQEMPPAPPSLLSPPLPSLPSLLPPPSSPPSYSPDPPGAWWWQPAPPPSPYPRPAPPPCSFSLCRDVFDVFIMCDEPECARCSFCVNKSSS